MRGLLTAIGFLTVAPVGHGEPREGDFGRATVWFPVVGLLVGVTMAGVDWCGRVVWDPYVAGALVLGAGLVLTGGLHVDGLMDTADGVFSGKPRERVLEIMRDARSGALGVAGGVSVLMAKLAAYGHLQGPEHWRVIAAAPVVGRMAIVVAAGVFPYAREMGTGARFSAETKWWHVVGAIAMGAAVAGALLGWRGLVLGAAGAAAALGVGLLVSRRLGGLTGDVYGAINELVELGALLAGALVLRGVI